jgi:hypothetical protein
MELVNMASTAVKISTSQFSIPNDAVIIVITMRTLRLARKAQIDRQIE